MSAICAADDELESVSSGGSDVGGQDDEQNIDPLPGYMYDDLKDNDGFHRSAAFTYFSSGKKHYVLFTMLIGQMSAKHGNVLECPPYNSTKKRNLLKHSDQICCLCVPK